MAQVHEHIHGSYDIILVLFSYIVAIVASYTVLDLVDRISTSKGIRRWIWMLFGAIAMGMGIWSMHFVGMLALSLPISVAYDLSLVFLSVVAAIAGSFIALFTVGRAQVTLSHLLGGAILLAAGIVAMHYIGMAAMVIDITYDPLYFTLSIIIALAASLAALWLSFYFRQDNTKYRHWKKIGSALMMGAAVAGMHYVGMKAANFHVGEKMQSSNGIVLDQQWLGYLIVGGTLFTLVLSLFGIYISNRFSHKNVELEEKALEIHRKNEELRQLNDHLEELVHKRTAELERAHDEAIKANMIKSQFLANMSHELRTPLNAIIGYSEMLMEEVEQYNDQLLVEDLSKIRKAGNHLLALINDILDISKIEAGKMEVYAEEFELQTLLQDIESTVRPVIEAKGNQLNITAADGVMNSDITKLRQIIINLLSNAGKFTENGIVGLEVKSQSKDGVHGYSFAVKDSGIGMTEEQIAKLFQPFTQADNSTTRKYGGTGLGLAISQRFAQLIGGEITVTSQINVGSTFTCWFPASINKVENAVQEHREYVAQEEAYTSQVNILLIDDEPFNYQLMQRYLAKEGWTLAFSETGAKGIELALQLRPHVILLDILMPSMDGWTVLAAIKSHPELQDIPVVIWSMTNDKQLGYTLGASEFLTKPLQRDRLLQVMNKYIPMHGDQTVLVIEDDAATNELMTRLLHKEGYSVIQARNGKLALDYMGNMTPNLILLDLMMPEMDGFTFVEEVRKVQLWNEIPIIVITAKSITEEDRRKLNGNVKSIIQKGSVDHKKLMEEIQQLVELAVERT